MDQVRKNIKSSILEQVNSCLELKDLSKIKELPLKDNVFDCGLDSMDFAIIVTELEDVLGYDPFVLEEDPIYPETFNDFIQVYFKHSSHFVQEK